MAKNESYAEITMKSGAVVTIDCVSVGWKTGPIVDTLSWELSEAAVRRPVKFDLDEIAAVVFVDGSTR